MFQFIQESLFYFRGCFSRSATFHWFIVVMAGFISRSDHFGFGAKKNYPTFAMINGTILCQEIEKREWTEDVLIAI